MRIVHSDSDNKFPIYRATTNQHSIIAKRCTVSYDPKMSGKIKDKKNLVAIFIQHTYINSNTPN